MEISQYKINKVLIGEIYTIKDFEKLWKIRLTGNYHEQVKFYNILDENFDYIESGNTKNKTIEIIEKIDKERVSCTSIMANMIYYVIHKHIVDNMLDHTFFNVSDMEEVRIYSAHFNNMLIDIGFRPYDVYWKKDEVKEKEKFFELVGDVKNRARNYLRTNEMMDIVRYCENPFGEDMKDTLTLFEYYTICNTTFNKMFPSDGRRKYFEIFDKDKFSDKNRMRYFKELNPILIEKTGFGYKDITIDYHVKVISDYEVAIDKAQVNKLMSTLVAKARVPKKEKIKENEIEQCYSDDDNFDVDSYSDGDNFDVDSLYDDEDIKTRNDLWGYILMNEVSE